MNCFSNRKKREKKKNLTIKSTFFVKGGQLIAEVSISPPLRSTTSLKNAPQKQKTRQLKQKRAKKKHPSEGKVETKRSRNGKKEAQKVQGVNANNIAV